MYKQAHFTYARTNKTYKQTHFTYCYCIIILEISFIDSWPALLNNIAIVLMICSHWS